MKTKPFWIVIVVLLFTSTQNLKAALLDYTLGDAGISSLTYNSQVLAKGDGITVEYAQFRRANGTTYNLSGYDKVAWQPRKGNTIIAKEPWGQLSFTYSKVAETVFVKVAILNLTADVMTGCEIRLQNLTFPDIGKAKFWTFASDMFWSNDAPNVGFGYWSSEAAMPLVDCDFGTGCLALGCTPVLGGADTNVVLQPPADGYPLFCKIMMNNIAPGVTKTRQYYLRFGPAGTDPYGSFHIKECEKYAATKPLQVRWDDRRPIIQETTIANGIVATPQNPRCYQTSQDLRTDAGKAAFRSELMVRADSYIAKMKKADAQGIVFWSIEGIEQLNIMYTGDPTRIELAPEMEYKDKTGVATVDAFLKRFTDAGFRVGHCIRPHQLRLTRYDFGTVFKPMVDGKITKMRIYASFRESPGEHIGRIWRKSDGKLIGGPYKWRFGNTNGWLELDIPDVTVSADTEYTVAITTGTPEGAWASRTVGTETWANNNAHLQYRAVSVQTTNIGKRPTEVSTENYLRDVVFVPHNSQQTETALGDMEPTAHYKPIEHYDTVDPAKMIIDIIKYAQRRWGSSMFYMDSTTKPNGSGGWDSLDGSVWKRVQEAVPNVLVMPENQNADTYPYAIPWDEGGFHFVFRTPSKVRAQWPGAFTAIHFDLFNNYTPDRFQYYVDCVKQGNILFFQPWDKDTDLVVSIYKQAGAVPIAHITSPASQTTFKPGRNITIKASASDRDGKIKKVEFYASTVENGRMLLGSDATAPYSNIWKNARPGRYVISVRAIDNKGLEVWPAERVIHVMPNKTKPVKTK